MGDERQEFLEPRAFEGAMQGARAGLGLFGIEADDEICTQVAISVLAGFTVNDGLQPKSLERLRDVVVGALNGGSRRHDV